MAEKDKVFETKVKHSGVFDFKETYSFIYTLLSDLEYSVEEKAYSEKTKGDRKEIEINWTAKRKVSDYFRLLIKADFRILGMSEVEVMKDGVKTSMNKGDFEVKFSCFLEKDYENRWEGSALLRFWRGVYDRYIIKSVLDGYKDQVQKETIDTAEQTKAFLALTVAR